MNKTKTIFSRLGVSLFCMILHAQPLPTTNQYQFQSPNVIQTLIDSVREINTFYSQDQHLTLPKLLGLKSTSIVHGLTEHKFMEQTNQLLML